MEYKKLDRTDQKLTLQKLKFLITGYKGITNNKMISLSETARDFFYLLECFGKIELMTKFLSLWLLQDTIQKIEASTCGPCQLCFYETLLSPNGNSKLHDKTRQINTTKQIIYARPREKRTNNKQLYWTGSGFCGEIKTNKDVDGRNIFR